VAKKKRITLSESRLEQDARNAREKLVRGKRVRQILKIILSKNNDKASDRSL